MINYQNFEELIIDWRKRAEKFKNSHLARDIIRADMYEFMADELEEKIEKNKKNSQENNI